MSNASDSVLRLLPRSLRARTNLLLISGLCVVQAAGLTIHALDHLNIADRAEMHENEHHAFSIYHTLVELPPSDREASLAALEIPSNFKVNFDNKPDTHLPGAFIPIPFGINPMMRGGPPGGQDDQGMGGPPPPGGGPGEFSGGEGRPPFPFEGGPPPSNSPDGVPPEDHRPASFMPPPLAAIGMLPMRLRPQHVIIGHKPSTRRYALSFQMPDDHRWLVMSYTVRPPNPFGSPTFMISFALMTICGGGLILWGSHRLIAPVATLANAATALGRNVHAQPLPESGPTEIRKAALAFNTMSARIRRFVTDRTLMLTAIGHDLRTPITRLKLRAEFIDDDELRDKFLADLDEMESMVAATLAFGRDSSTLEPMTTIDLSALLQTVADEAAEARPDLADEVSYAPPQTPIRIKARSLALKRALTNLVMNALKYGGSVSIRVIDTRTAEQEKAVCIHIDDRGPGLPPEDLERMFEPFVRAETSRNRETGGTGLGLAIARSTLRVQGGDVTLSNRPEGGLRASVVLPI
ncbi:ATP-binding protein [Asaia astilbis]